LLENGDRQGAITAFERAIAIAESQKSRSLEVRARESLERLRNSI
jgi:hypothetical protein